MFLSGISRRQDASPFLVLVLLLVPSPSWAAVVTTDEGPDFLERVSTVADFESIAAQSSTSFGEKHTKFLLPARDEPALLPPVFQNVRRYPFHYEFMAGVFPDRFPGLTFEEYRDLVERRENREYYAGTLTRFSDFGSTSYGFNVFTSGIDPEELLEPEELLAIYTRLRVVFELSPLEYVPIRAAEILKAQSWEDPGFPIRFASEPRDVIGYTNTTNYGRLRRLTLAELQTAIDDGELDWQTLVVVDEAPPDIDTVVAGVVTGTPQGDLSHLAVRLARRQVPNAFVRNAREEFEKLDGELVRLDVEPESYTVRAATLSEAESWWNTHRPNAPPIPVADASYDGLDGLTEIDVNDPNVEPVERFGGKAANLAILYGYLPAEHRVPGFAIPFRYYLEFMQSNRIPAIDDPITEETYEEHIRGLLADPRFRSDGAFRRLALRRLRKHAREEGEVPTELVDRIRDRILDVFGDPSVKVRFRSSSNAEDSPEFPGSGLYDSTSVCMPDELDDDENGPSRCDTSKKDERTILRGLRLVWMSLWNARAFEEREYFQIDHRRAAMAVLVTLAFPDEDANGVAFTGNPANREDHNFIVNVQLGDESVVSPGVGIEPEKDIIVMRGDDVARTILVRSSSLAVPGQRVLSDDQLELLGTVIAQVEDPFLDHFDLGSHSRENVLVDFEFKFQDGQLVIKQARPFLVEDSSSDGAIFVLEVPPDTQVCGQFQDDRPLETEYRLKGSIRLAPGAISLPVRGGFIAADLIEQVEYGPQRQVLEPVSSGVFHVSQRGPAWYRWHFDQEFRLDGERVRVFLDWHLTAGTDPATPNVVNLDEPFFTGNHFIAAAKQDQDPGDLTVFKSCSYDLAPLWESNVQFEDGGWARFRLRSVLTLVGSGETALRRGEAFLGGQHRMETSYWKLVYAADRHNSPENFCMLFTPPLTVGDVPTVAALLVVEEKGGGVPTGRRAALLDDEFHEIGSLAIESYSQILVTPIFSRGDVNEDARTDLSDATFILNYLFAGGSEPACLKSSDMNDSGTVDISDAVYLLTYLFLGGRPPQNPFNDCGVESTEDDLSCGSTQLCPWSGKSQP